MDCKENCLHCAEKCNTKSNTNQHGNCELKSELKDEELIKDLKTFISLSKHITEPPYVQHIFLQQILDLINRQKAEIEALQLNVEDYAETIVELNTQCKELKAEIEMLKKNLNDTSKCNIYLMNRIDKAKSEAIKEFAEKVYRFLCNWRNWNKLKVSWLFNGECEWLKKSLDNLVKEMDE